MKVKRAPIRVKHCDAIFLEKSYIKQTIQKNNVLLSNKVEFEYQVQSNAEGLSISEYFREVLDFSRLFTVLWGTYRPIEFIECSNGGMYFQIRSYIGVRTTIQMLMILKEQQSLTSYLVSHLLQSFLIFMKKKIS